jgi:hypothetical protein
MMQSKNEKLWSKGDGWYKKNLSMQNINEKSL